jgi:glutamyl-tRNA reductase
VNRHIDVLGQFAENTVTTKMSLADFLKNPPDFSHLFTATASVEPIFEWDFFNRLGPEPKAVFDFAQPADVGLVENPSIEVFRLENLQNEAQKNREARVESVRQAETLIEEALRSHLLEQKETPVLRDFNQIQVVFEEELLRAYEFIESDFPKEFHSNLKRLADTIVKKNLHSSREHLRTVLRRAADIGPDPIVV